MAKFFLLGLLGALCAPLISVSNLFLFPLLAVLGALTALGAQAQRTGETDPLTTLPNRRCLTRRQKKYRGTLRVFFLDVDRLKQINDTQGHAAGDQVLRQLATSLKALPGDSYRIGGDEFLLIQTNRHAQLLPEQLSLLSRCASFGLAEGCNLSALIPQAEGDLYRQKRAN